FHLVRVRARPWRHHHSRFDRNIGIFALGHVGVSVNAPNGRADQQHPRDMGMLHTKPRRIAGCQQGIARPRVVNLPHGITSTVSPLATMVAPARITSSPGFTPLVTAKTSPKVGPRLTRRARATLFSTTITSKSAGFSRSRITAFTGITGTAAGAA